MLVVVVSLAVFGATLAINPNLQCAPDATVGPCLPNWNCSTPDTICLPIGGGDWGCCPSNKVSPICPQGGCQDGASTGPCDMGPCLDLDDVCVTDDSNELVCCPEADLTPTTLLCNPGASLGPCNSGPCGMAETLCLPIGGGDLGCCPGDEITGECQVEGSYCKWGQDVGPCLGGTCQSGASCVALLTGGEACCPTAYIRSN
ncbi:unnamed protein product, partial [Mesorhabditis spiculigera]